MLAADNDRSCSVLGLSYMEVDAMTKFVPEQLRKAAEIYEQRNKLYGDNYKYFGEVVHSLFPEGISVRAGETKKSYYNRIGVLIQIISKLARYCQNFDSGGHDDSLDDIVVYAMMLKELDQVVEEPFIDTRHIWSPE